VYQQSATIVYILVHGVYSMVTKRKKRSKSKKRKSSKPRREKKQTKLNQLKETQNDLTVRVEENINQIQRNSGLEKEQIISFVRKNGYDALKKLPNIQISEPILNGMIKTFKFYDKLNTFIPRMEEAERKLHLQRMEQMTIELEEQVAKMEEQDSFYTDLPDKQGFVQMKQKYHAEKEFWEGEKAKAEALLALDEEDRLGLEGVAEAKRELKILSKKRNWARAKNIQPNIQKWTGKVTKVINTVQDSVQEITKPFAEAGKSGTSGQAGNTDYEKMFSPEHIFDTGKKKKSVEESFGAGF